MSSAIAESKVTQGSGPGERLFNGGVLFRLYFFCKFIKFRDRFRVSVCWQNVGFVVGYLNGWN